MSTSNFMINRLNFKASLNPIQSQNRFSIKSVPRSYGVVIDETNDPVLTINRLLATNSKNLLLIDARVHELYGLNLSHLESKVLKVPATEEFKSIDGFLQVISFMTFNQITKGEKLIVVGGGIIQDVAAFAAATYKRGIPWVYFPTTLLSQSDSCIGGKTGLNHQGVKNQLALFSAPAEVIINPTFLKTLKPQEIRSGMGEILKLHITGGIDTLKNYIKNQANEGDTLSFESSKALILGALAVKKVVVEEDEFELDLRRSMNYGHTFGHAIEVLSDYRIPHGQAVTIGLILVNELSFSLGFLQLSERNQIRDLALKILDKSVLEIMKLIEAEGILKLLKQDKKTLGSRANFIIIHQIGDMRVLSVELDEKLLNQVIHILRETFH